MALDLSIQFSTAGNFTYDASLIQVAGSIAELVDLGGGTYSTANPTIELDAVIQATALTAWGEWSTVGRRSDTAAGWSASTPTWWSTRTWEWG